VKAKLGLHHKLEPQDDNVEREDKSRQN